MMYELVIITKSNKDNDRRFQIEKQNFDIITHEFIKNYLSINKVTIYLWNLFSGDIFELNRY